MGVMYTRLLVFKTKLLIKVLRMLGKNASALPGLIVERFSPRFLDTALGPVQDKIVIISGTNGKTTTTKMVVHALRSSGARVVTNSTGSNMTRGLISALIDDMTLSGTLRPTDWFVFEMDEAYAPKFTANLSIKAVLALNVLRDQLDRYGEIDTTAKLIGSAAQKADQFIYNAHDPLLHKIAQSVAGKNVHTTSFGVVKKLTAKLKNEQSMFTKAESAGTKADYVLSKSQENNGTQQIEVVSEHKNVSTELPFIGMHNALNATAACALLAQLSPDTYHKQFVAISTMQTPFGRGENIRLNNKNITVALVKNPSGFTHNLETFVTGQKPDHVLFVVNDRFADGRDVSWLWDVQFKDVIPKGTSISCSGIRAYDMALRLKHDGYEASVTTDVKRAIERLMSSSDHDIAVIPTYTALYEARSALSRYGGVPRIW